MLARLVRRARRWFRSAAVAMAERARQEANRRFAKDRYYRDLRQTVDGLASVAASSSTGPRPNGDQKQR